MYNVAIRADGGQVVGMGHIMRCLAIAEELKSLGCRVYFIGRYLQGLKKIKDVGYEAFEILLPQSEIKYTQEVKSVNTHNFADTGFSYGSVEELGDDIFETRTIVEQQGCNLLLVDKYNLTSEYFDRLRGFVEKVAFTDDLNLFTCSANIIINGNINANLLRYKECFSNQKLLLGTKFTPLRREFSNIPKRETRSFIKWNMARNINQKEMKDFDNNKKNKDESRLPEIMITTGGSDPYNCTGKLLEILLEDKETANIRYNVILGSGFVRKDEIQRMADKNSNIVLYIDPKCMTEIICRSDLAISSGGSTLYELCCCGTPTMAFIMADNQKGIVDMLSDDGYIQSLGWYNEIENQDIPQQVYKLIMSFEKRMDYSQKMQSLIDGRGANRIAKEIIDIITI